MRKSARLFTCLLLAGFLFLGGCGEEDPIYGDWIKFGYFDGPARGDAVSFCVGEKGFVFGGFDANNNRLRDLWEYDAVMESWKLVENDTITGAKRSSATAFAVNGKGYVGTGFDGENYLKDFWRFDPETEDWERVADFGGTARYGATSFALNGKGYVGMGYDGNHLKDFWEYDPNADTWTQIPVPSGLSKRKNPTAFVIGTKAYIVCGLDNGQYVTDFWSFDPTQTTNNGWTELNEIRNTSGVSFDDDYEIARANALVLVIDGKGYLTCGESGSLRSDTWIYDPSDDRWESTTDFEGTPRTGAVSMSIKVTSGASAGEHGYVMTGRSSTYRFDDMWEFLPEAEYDEGY